MVPLKPYRCFLNAWYPNKSPNCSRIVETIFFELAAQYAKERRDSRQTYISRFSLILCEYSKIQNAVKNCGLAELITLPQINETTLKRWMKDHAQLDELTTLLGGRPQIESMHISESPNSIYKFYENKLFFSITGFNVCISLFFINYRTFAFCTIQACCTWSSTRAFNLSWARRPVRDSGTKEIRNRNAR